MADNMYSAEEAAQLLGLQVRTVRNYVREGRLPGVRIGKQYRIARADLEAFTSGGLTRPVLPGAEPLAETPQAAVPVAEVSSVVDIDGVDAGLRDRLERTLEAAALAADPDAAPARLEPIYDEPRGRLKIIVVGGLMPVAEILRILDALTADRRGNRP